MALVRAQAVHSRTASLVEQAQRGLKRGLDRSANEARGRLRVAVASWKHKPDFQIDAPDDTTRIISTDDDIFLFQDAGTKPHTIVPRYRRYLRFVPRSGNAYVFAKRVHHPGTQPANWTKNIARQMVQRMPVIFAETMKES